MESDNNAVIKFIPETEKRVKEIENAVVKHISESEQLLADFAEKRTKEIEAEDKAINDNLRRFESRVFTAFGASYYDDDKD